MNELENINPFQILSKHLVRIEEMLEVVIEVVELNRNSPTAVQSELLSVSQAAAFLVLSKQAVYRNIAKIPHYKRNGRLYFKRDELIEYVEGGKYIVRKSSTFFR
ncbi:MAG: hypothetical protein BGO21_22145 [Dyadobacter sp. 50-39]|uniref:helix-turn-helix domain-containing protein n=1 Tax=Dyadobacter sp. 50-39 TaxID=1895756 RepID=UPI000968EAAB|nr:helix-turn-helix domain-containing protein [Dyadobacter sp. 50-39]OJV19764.1 MAG: hypothetical protein BGO21_22145 [Dyadobacter sp. 50-39]